MLITNQSFMPIYHNDIAIEHSGNNINVHLQVKRVEEQHNIFSLVVRELDVLELTIDNSSSFELRCRLLNGWDRHVDLDFCN